MRVKLTFTFSALGTCMPLVVRVTGLTEREMPDGKDFIYAKVPGLCIGGGGVNIENQACGWVVLMRNTEGAEKEYFQWYQDTILLPGINDHRKQFGKYDDKSGRECPDKLTAVTWCNGDLSQISAIKKCIENYTANKVIACKQHAARSAVEQPADLAKVFMVIKELLPHYTVKDIPPERHSMKELIFNAFLEHKVLKQLSLANNKKNAIIDFLSTLPDVASKACTTSNIRHGFIQAGIIDKDRYRFPVFNKILATCRRNPMQEEYNCIIENFEDFIGMACNHGHLTKDLFDVHGIMRDQDCNGNEVLRNAGISQEWNQRIKCLAHNYQVDL